MDGNQWEEIEFLYKPGDPSAPLPFIAPHQPRLDWQMWFAALGDYNGAPWLVHLVHKLLHGCAPVLHLLDQDRYPFKDGQAPTKIRAKLYHYDFTRLETSWNARLGLPNASFVKGAGVGGVDPTTPVWTRSFVRNYLPPVALDDPSVRQFLKHFGWDHDPAKSKSSMSHCSTTQAVSPLALPSVDKACATSPKNETASTDTTASDACRWAVETASRIKSATHEWTLKQWRLYGTVWAVLVLAAMFVELPGWDRTRGSFGRDGRDKCGARESTGKTRNKDKTS